MRSQSVTQQEVFTAAKKIVAQGKVPTLAEIRLSLGDRGSQSTIHKYLKEWKQHCFQQGIEGLDPDSVKDHKHLLAEKRSLEHIIEKQIQQNEMFTAQLIEAEKTILEMREKVQQFQKEASLAKEIYEQIKSEHEKLIEVHAMMLAERDNAIQKILEDKNQLIGSLRQELKEFNHASLLAIRDLGYRGDEALLAEKLRSVHLQDKVDTLEKTLSILQAPLVKGSSTRDVVREFQEAKGRVPPQSIDIDDGES